MEFRFVSPGGHVSYEMGTNAQAASANTWVKITSDGSAMSGGPGTEEVDSVEFYAHSLSLGVFYDDLVITGCGEPVVNTLCCVLNQFAASPSFEESTEVSGGGYSISGVNVHDGSNSLQFPAPGGNVAWNHLGEYQGVVLINYNYNNLTFE